MIDNNPAALRAIADNLQHYMSEHAYMLDVYCQSMLQLDDSIQVEAFGQVLENIEAMKRDLQRQMELCTVMVRMLLEKAVILENLQKSNSQIEVADSGSYGVSAKVSPPDRSHIPDRYAHSVCKLEELPKGLPAVPSQTFKDEQYVTYRVTSPIIGYRYFGSLSYQEMRDVLEQVPDAAFQDESIRVLREKLRMEEEIQSDPDLVFERESEEASRERGWGSDAGGRWLVFDVADSQTNIPNDLALKKAFGNSSKYVAKIELPIGAVISVGIAAAQQDVDECLTGGAIQIYVHSCPDEDIPGDESVRDRSTENSSEHDVGRQLMCRIQKIYLRSDLETKQKI